ncbi:alpha/beta fold hydrolase [Variovorax robiniae]|uniref:Alpha/beta fold hydrolase n=1 Tax=Variovorax robiniae TaxID=1836199 RepID=A0ABU8XL69_9BURK
MPLAMAFEALGSGAPVVILHGLFSAGRNWTHFAQLLAADYRVYLPDARNHGASPWASSMSYPDMALDVRLFIEDKHMLRPFVVGHSMGGKTAMALALAHPQSVAGITVVDTAPEFYANQFSAYMAAMQGLDLATTRARRGIRDTLADQLNRGASVEFQLRNLRSQRERFDWRMNLLATAARMRELCGFPASLHGARYEGPALFISGAESDYVRPESRASIRALFPNAEFKGVIDAGHWVHADQPEALLADLRGWLGEACTTPH